MKRLLAQIGITYFSVLAAAFYLSDKTVIIIGAAALLAFVILAVVPNTRKTVYLPAVALFAAIACAVNVGYSALAVLPVTERYGGEEHTVRAVLEDEPNHPYSTYYYRLRATEIDGEEAHVKILLEAHTDLDVETDDILTFTSVLSVTDFAYYRSKGYYLTSDSFDIILDAEPADSHSAYYYAVRLRQMMRRALDVYLPEDCAALCKAVLLGDKYAMSSELRDEFRYAGASYYIVVSGMHFSAVCMLMLILLRRFNRWVRFGLIMGFILIYSAVTGFQSSVVRSGIMMVFTVIGITIRRQPYPLNHLGIAGLLMSFIVTPYGAGDIGLILSFYATLAILLWAEPISKKICFTDEYGNIYSFAVGNRLRLFYSRLKGFIIGVIKRGKRTKKKKEPAKPFDFRLFLKKLWNTVGALLSVSLSANILVFPISVYVFRAFSLMTLFSALALYAEIYLILLLSFAVCVLYWIAPMRFLAMLLSFPLFWLCRIVLSIVKGIASLPFAYYRVDGGYFYIWLAVSILLGAAVIIARNGYRYLKYAAFCSAVILLAGGITHELLQTQALSLEVYSCGRGVCAGINSDGRLHILSMDAKSLYLYDVWEELSYRFNGADSALCPDEKNLKYLNMYSEEEFAISTIMLYDKDESGGYDENVLTFSDDSVFIADDEVTVSVSVQNDIPIPYIKAGESSILIIPDGCSANDIPADKLSADIIVMSTAAPGMEALRCRDLIISDEGDTALLTANALKACYQNVYFTDKGNVNISLR